MKKKKYKIKDHMNAWDKVFWGLLKIFHNPAKFKFVGTDKIEKRSIIVGNHDGAGGAYNIRGAFYHNGDQRAVIWGAHQMCEGYISRWKYLYFTFYQQKLHWSKFKAFNIATLFGLVAGMAYRFGCVMPVYYDNRIKTTYEISMEALNKDISVIIFPEDSSKGYQKVLSSFHSGFLALVKLYTRRYKTDLPIYPTYYDRRNKLVYVGKPIYYNQYKDVLTDDEIIDLIRNEVNQLYYDYVKVDKK